MIFHIRQLYNGKECFSAENTEMKVLKRHKNWREIHIKNAKEMEPFLVFIKQSYDANQK